jgi:ATP-binding cassette subfamily G (WHITE) protein 2
MFGSLQTITSFPNERLLTLRERANGFYNVSAYFLARSLAENITQILTPIFFSVTVYWLVGFQNLAGNFFIFLLFMILCTLAANSLALAISCIAKTTALSVTILPMALEISRLFGGFFLAPAVLPNYFSWLDALSYVKYTYVGVALNELQGLTIHCPAGATNCPAAATTIDTLGLDYITIGGCIGALFAYIVGLRIIAYFFIRYLKY